MIVSGLYIYNHFSDCVDQGYYLSNDKINDVACFPKNRKETDHLVPVLACNDGNLRVLEVILLKNILKMCCFAESFLFKIGQW